MLLGYLGVLQMESSGVCTVLTHQLSVEPQAVVTEKKGFDKVDILKEDNINETTILDDPLPPY